MKVYSEVIRKTEQRSAAADPPDEGGALAILGPATAPAAVPASATEIKQRVENLSFAGARFSNTEYERMMGSNDLVDEFYLERALAAARPVCRVVLRNDAGREIGWATGFLISPRVLITNWHVFRMREEAQNAIAEFDYRLDIRGNPTPSVRFLVRPDKFYYSNRDLDYALAAVEETSMDGGQPLSQYSYHRLVPTPGKILEGEWITIIQHPSGQRRQFAIRENQLIEKADQFLWYMSDTAQGSSGAPAFNDSFQVVALHHSGKAKKDGSMYVLKDGRKVASLEGVDDSEVIWEKNEGVRVSVMCQDMELKLDPADQYVREIKEAAASETGHVMARVLAGNLTPAPQPAVQPVAPAVPTAEPAPVLTAATSTAGITIPLHLQVSVSQTTTTVPAVITESAAVAIAAEFEKAIPPPVDNDYSSREGYDPDFLLRAVPLPTVVDLKQVSKLDDGSHVIPYEHYSLVLHKKRRLAIFTASNIDGTDKMRKPEPGLYTRKALFGITKDADKESWLTDPRIPKQHQLPEVFYDKDGGAFDKGHIVRREDVCWGKTRKQIVKANADSYHVTNCSPQVAGYNQAAKHGLWGQLENVVLDQAEEQQQFSVFAGPVLADDDRFFDGRDVLGDVHIQIPKRFWKIVVAEKEGKLQAFGFLLEQDLSTVALENEEFKVTEEWTPYLISIQDLEDELGLIRFPQVLKDVDGSLGNGGDELVRKKIAKRKTRKRPAVAGAGG